jgi:hypothetical protein
MKQQFVVIHLYIVSQETEKTWQVLNRPTFKHVMFLWEYKESHIFCGHKILTEGVFVSQLSSSVEILIWRIVWVVTNFCPVSDMFCVFIKLSDSRNFPIFCFPHWTQTDSGAQVFSYEVTSWC